MPSSRAFFDAVAPRYDRDFGFSGAETRRRLAPLLAVLGPPRRVLDLGIGTGRELAPLLDAGHEVVGLDSSPNMLAECNKRARPVRVVLGDFYEPLPWDDASFDAVIALHGTLAHPPFEGALESLCLEVARLLRPSGRLWFEVPHDGFLMEAARLGLATHEGGFDASDPRTGATLRGVAWSAERWHRTLPGTLHVQLAPDPSPYEIAVHAERR